MNRGLARRTSFETRADVRFFLTRLASEVRASRIEIHAFCILTTHDHLLLRSPSGELSRVMQRVQNEYSRWFNRGRQRDGPLYRSRFLSKPVRSEHYRKLLVRHIDANPVTAGLVVRLEDYPHGSARRHAQGAGPVWLERSWVESKVCAQAGRIDHDPARYSTAFGAHRDSGGFALVERRTRVRSRGEDPLDDLLGGAVGKVRDWMCRKTTLADGTTIGLPVCDVESVVAVLEEARRRNGPWEVQPNERIVDAWPIAHVGLPRSLCGSTLLEAGARTRRTLGSAWVLEDRHRRLLRESETYAVRVAAIAKSAVERCHRAPVAAQQGGPGIEATTIEL